ncbi:hypothetical protein DFR70_119152 [Nocardia tenerifensis]|uniref:Uncharacterized protein n=1 Tax=Nocardia tenerifensis TaxID=228006 RepID=A0A318K3L8_9NOCA|nr:hypothetical protein [Nocardia tenerifensis]PXX56600.1 hypothetical protein DFR70_119152 [Nocardia tenerifensis]
MRTTRAAAVTLLTLVGLLVMTMLTSGSAAANPPSQNPFWFLPDWFQQILFCYILGSCY